MINNVEFKAYYSIQSDAIELYVRSSPIGSNYHLVGQPIEFKDGINGTFINPIIRLSRDEAQTLCDSLWEAGLRPVGAKGSTGQLTAVQYHLEDMRKLVFNDRSSTKSS